MKDFEINYRKWSWLALISILVFLFSIFTIDAFLGFDFSKDMYVMAIVSTESVFALILICKLMKSDFRKDNNEGMDKHTEALAPAEDTGKSISMSDIEMCIREEGYIPQVEENRLLFNIEGERFEVYYQDEKFTLIKKFSLGEDVDMDLLLRACSLAQDEIIMFRSYVHTYEEGNSILCFETETYISSAAELKKFFPRYLNILLLACGRQKELYHQQVEESLSKKVEQYGSDFGTKVVS